MRAYFQLIRTVNCFMVAVAVAIGALVAIGPEGISIHYSAVGLACCAAFLFTGAGNSLNDYFDRDIDRINHPSRPIPAGKVRPDAALLLAFFMFLSSLVIASFVNILVIIIVVANLVVMVSYEIFSKAKGMAGNLTISWLTGTTFLFGGAAVLAIENTLVLAALAFLATLGREIAKDIEDVEGDVGRSTVPMQVGSSNASIMISSAILASVLLSPLPAMMGIFSGSGWIFFILLIAVADAMFIYCIFLVAKGKPSASNAIKGAMAVALVAFLSGGILQGS